jgi:hypothetical protein
MTADQDTPSEARSLQLLASIDRHLAVLAGAEEAKLRDAIVGFLKTESRVKMFDALDGRRRSPDLARLAGIIERSAQRFVQELIELRWVRSCRANFGCRRPRSGSGRSGDRSVVHG